MQTHHTNEVKAIINQYAPDLSATDSLMLRLHIELYITEIEIQVSEKYIKDIEERL